MFKKLLTIGIAAATLFSFVACKNPTDTTTEDNSPSLAGSITGTWEGELIGSKGTIISLTFNGEKVNVTKTVNGQDTTYELFYTKIIATEDELKGESDKYSTFEELFLLSEKKLKEAPTYTEVRNWNNLTGETKLGKTGFIGGKEKLIEENLTDLFISSYDDNYCSTLYPKA